MGLTERHLFENEDVPENYEWALEDAVYNSLENKKSKDSEQKTDEEQAVPVTQREIMHLLIWCCGSCGVAITDGDKFCRHCGKALKW
jgi:hypothetical protein